MTTPSKEAIARELLDKLGKIRDPLNRDPSHSVYDRELEVILSVIDKATEELRKDRDLWKAQSEFESKHREKYRQRLLSRAAQPQERRREAYIIIKETLIKMGVSIKVRNVEHGNYTRCPKCKGENGEHVAGCPILIALGELEILLSASAQSQEWIADRLRDLADLHDEGKEPLNGLSNFLRATAARIESDHATLK